MYVSRSIIYCAILILAFSAAIALLVKVLYPVLKEKYTPKVVNIQFENSSTEIYAALNVAGITMTDAQKNIFENAVMNKQKTLGFNTTRNGGANGSNT